MCLTSSHATHPFLYSLQTGCKSVDTVIPPQGTIVCTNATVTGFAPGLVKGTMVIDSMTVKDETNGRGSILLPFGGVGGTNLTLSHCSNGIKGIVCADA